MILNKLIQLQSYILKFIQHNKMVLQQTWYEKLGLLEKTKNYPYIQSTLGKYSPKNILILSFQLTLLTLLFKETNFVVNVDGSINLQIRPQAFVEYIELESRYKYKYIFSFVVNL